MHASAVHDPINDEGSAIHVQSSLEYFRVVWHFEFRKLSRMRFGLRVRQRNEMSTGLNRANQKADNFISDFVKLKNSAQDKLRRTYDG
jgi:hypothetical protein